MSEFRPYGLFYDVLSGEFTPPTDRLERAHTLARLAVATCENGRGPDYCRDYIPSWAENSYSMVEHGIDGPRDTTLTVATTKGRWLNIVRFSHIRSNPAMSPRSDNLIITRGGTELVRKLELGPKLNEIRREVADTAQSFYESVPV